MDYEKFILAHRETDADITVAALPMDEKRATAFGLMKIDDEGRIVEFAEKPQGEQLKAMKVHNCRGYGYYYSNYFPVSPLQFRIVLCQKCSMTRQMFLFDLAFCFLFPFHLRLILPF